MPRLLEFGPCYFFGRVGGAAGWEEKWRLELSQLPTEVEVEAELGNNLILLKQSEKGYKKLIT